MLPQYPDVPPSNTGCIAVEQEFLYDCTSEAYGKHMLCFLGHSKRVHIEEDVPLANTNFPLSSIASEEGDVGLLF